MSNIVRFPARPEDREITPEDQWQQGVIDGLTDAALLSVRRALDNVTQFGPSEAAARELGNAAQDLGRVCDLKQQIADTGHIA
ncbi:unannotated protein [freshwater metagenome]|uniref:Unannotated protein n=1 Tax=freshwater metagenome TaxID=449393 RepID=A0A6J7FML2_9ZZZZ|nr:hypothetical protein [Actinomycetota bacterium]